VKKLILLSIIFWLYVLPAGAVDWQPVGLEGAAATSMVAEPGLIFVTEIFGMHYLDIGSGLWTSHLDSIGIPMYTALTRYPPQPELVVLGGGTPIFTGYLAVSDDMGENVDFVTDTGSGTVTDMATSYSYEVFHLYASTGQGEFAPGKLLRSTDGGLSWQEMVGHMHDDLSAVVAIDTNEVWTAGDAQVTRTLDGGLTWESFQGDLNPALPVDCFWTEPAVVGIPDMHGFTNSRVDSDRLAKDEPYSYAGLLFASNAEGLFYSQPDTVEWQQVLPDPCRAVVGLFRQPSTFVMWYEVVAVTVDGRVLYSRSTDDFLDWADWTEGISPAVPIDVGKAGGYYVLTEQSGVFRTSLPISDVPDAGQRLQLTAYPNPFNPRTTFAFTVEQAGRCELAVFDLQGQQVATLLEREVDPGPVQISWQPEKLASGVYLARLVLGELKARQQVVLLK
jgi:hypothetical protein